MKVRNNIVEIAGWYGAAAILLAYSLVSFGVLRPDELFYQLLNLSGAIGIVVISLARGVRQPAVLNIVWSAVALVAILQIILR